MTFQEAKEELKILARGKAFQLRFSVLEFADGSQRPDCSVYVEGQAFHSGDTWEEAFYSLNKALNPAKVTAESITEMCPQEDCG